MRKSLLLATLLLLTTTSVMAAKVGDTTIGIEFGALNSDATSKVNGVSYNGDIDTTYETLRLGKYYDFGRIGANIGIINKDSGTDGYFIGGAYDYMFYNESKLVPFVGATLSYSWNEWNGSGITVDQDGFQYGIEAGTVYDISDKIELEIGARYLESTVDGSTTSGGNKIDIEVDSVIQYYISLGYKF